MEQIVAGLVEAFEHGRMTRRQLIQSLTATAAAAYAAGSSPISAAGAPMKVVAVNHISYQVADYAKTRDFYAGLLGMRASDDNGRQVRLSFGDQGTCLLARTARVPSTAPRIDHIAYTIEHWDRDAVKAELERRGLTPRPDSDLSFHVKDPDGFDVQIAART
jgi:catechol 2,3-dioxygenase-like lactoylglutathione lyase family enzyme